MDKIFRFRSFVRRWKMSSKGGKNHRGKAKSLTGFFHFKRNKRTSEEKNNNNNEQQNGGGGFTLRRQNSEPTRTAKRYDNKNVDDSPADARKTKSLRRPDETVEGLVVKTPASRTRSDNINKDVVVEKDTITKEPKPNSEPEKKKEGKQQNIITIKTENVKQTTLDENANITSSQTSPPLSKNEQLRRDFDKILGSKTLTVKGAGSERPKSSESTLSGFNKISQNTKTIVLNSTFSSSPKTPRSRMKCNKSTPLLKQQTMDNFSTRREGERSKNDYVRKYSLPHQRKLSVDLNLKNIKRASPIVLRKFQDHSLLLKPQGEKKKAIVKQARTVQLECFDDLSESTSSIDERIRPNQTLRKEQSTTTKINKDTEKISQSIPEKNVVLNSKQNQSPNFMRNGQLLTDSNEINEEISTTLHPQQKAGDRVKRLTEKTTLNTTPAVRNTKKNYSKFDLKMLEMSVTLGTGTFGRVFLVEDRQSSKQQDQAYAMKIMKIQDIIKLNQVEHVNSERKILQSTDHPFIVECFWTYRDKKCLYMLFEYVAGGELFTYLRNKGRFTSEDTKFYICEIISVLGYLHEKNIAYRDLKPENLLLDKEGHLKFTDFGFAKVVEDITWTLCGTPEYLSPEAIQGKGHDVTCDWWSLGILAYEMLVGEAPFVDDSPFGLYQKILSGTIIWPTFLDGSIEQDFIKNLVIERSERLGQRKGQTGAEEVKSHAWFDHVQWDDVENKRLKPPITPRVAFKSDTSNFDDFDENFQMDQIVEVSKVDENKFLEWDAD